MDIEKKYSNKDITVVWKPKQCIHSTLCWKGLIDVFNPREKPWVKIDGASTERIKDQVTKCPSGAISYYNNNQVESESAVTKTETIVEASVNGPLLVYGNIQVKDANGTTVKTNKVTAFCRCGASENKPYCDGSHRKINFNG